MNSPIFGKFMADTLVIDNWLSKQERTLQGEPIYRLVFSDTQTEIRVGVFNDYTGNILLRRTAEARETKKYPFINSRYVLEKWFPPEYIFTPEVPMTVNGSYEPFFVFEDSKGNYLEPTLKVVEFIVGATRNPGKKITPGDRAAQYALSEEREVQAFMDLLECSPVTNALHMKEAVGYTKEIKQ